MPLPRNWRRSMIGSSWPRTLARPLIQALAPGTRVVLAGTPRTSRVSSRATRYRSPAMRSATPTHSRPLVASWFSCADTARPRRSSSASSSKGRSRRDFSSTWDAVLGSLMRSTARPWGAPGCGVRSRGQGRLRLGDQLIGGYRFDHVVDRPLAQAPDAVGLLALGGHHDDRDGAGARVVGERARGLVAVHARHHDVHEDEVGVDLAR